ncbi:hypothetical protein SAMN02910289_01873 [Lachnospiraceae bacterium RM5]|nr:hypothetical protein SAMN02910289_01873 [Lachnospiraceae bacterium RM5]
MEENSKAYYPRRYRYLDVNIKKIILYLCFFVIPLFALMCYFLDDITFVMVFIADKALGLCGEKSFVLYEKIKIFKINYLAVNPDKINMNTVYINLFLSLIGLFICNEKKFRGHPKAVFLSFFLLIHFLTSMYYFFAADVSFINGTYFSKVFIMQQVCILFMSFLIMVFFTAILSDKNYINKILFILFTIIYMMVYLVINYIVAMLIICRFSIIYSVIVFIGFGIVLDILNIYMFCEMYTSKVSESYYQNNERGKWKW